MTPTRTALSGGDVTLLRGRSRVKRYLSVAPLTQVASARVNQMEFDIPLAALQVDSTTNWSGVVPGMIAWIGTSAGARDIGMYRVRLTPTSDTLYIGEMSSGDPGLMALSRLQALADDAYVTIYEDYNLWSVKPRIVYSGDPESRAVAYYLDYEIPYGTQNETDPPFILNIGPHRADWISGSTVSFPFVADPVTFLGSVVSYAWDFVDGTPSSSSNASETVSFPEGHRIISCTAELDTGAVVTAYRHVWAHSANYPPLSIEIQSDRRDQSGRQMRFRLTDLNAPLVAGTMAMYWEQADFSGSAIDEAVTQFCGWIRALDSGMEPLLYSVDYELVSGMELLKDTDAAAQRLEVVSNPSAWYECIAALSTMDFMLFHILHYHTTLLRLFDMQISGITTQGPGWRIEPGSIHQQLQQVGERFNAWVGQASDGTVWVSRDPVMLNTTDRDALPERMTVTESDASDIQISRRLRPEVGKVEAVGMVYSGGVVVGLRATAEGYVGGEGVRRDNLENQQATSQADLNIRAACRLAKLNNPYKSITVAMAGNYDVIEPAMGMWLVLNIAAAYWYEGVEYDERQVVVAVQVQHQVDGVKLIRLQLEPETDGNAAPAQTRELGMPDSSANAPYPDSSWIPLARIPYDSLTGLISIPYDPFDDFPDRLIDTEAYDPVTALVLALAWSTATLFYSELIKVPSPTWVEFLDPSPDEMRSAIHDAASPLALGTGDDIYLWALTSEELLYFAGVPGVDSWEVKQAFTGGQFLRAVAGVSGGIGVFGYDETEGAWMHTIDFTATDGGFFGDNPLPSGNLGAGVWSNGVGWEDESVSSQNRVRIELYGIAPFTIDEVVLTFDMTVSGTGTPRARIIAFQGALGGLTNNVMNDTSSPPTGTDVTFTGTLTVNNVTGFNLTLDASSTGNVVLKSMEISGTGFNPFEDTAWVKFSDDTGDSISATNLGIQNGNVAGDFDDYNLGVIIGGTNDGVYYTTAYDGAASAVSGLAGTGQITCIRIPFLKIDQTPNNDASALEFIYCTETGYIGRVVLDTTDGSVDSEIDISISIDGTDYYVIGPEAMESASADTRNLNAFAKPVGGGSTIMVRSTTGGLPWVVASEDFDGEFGRFEVGSTQRYFAAGPDRLIYTPNGGATLMEQDGNFTGDAKGFYGL